MLIKELAPGDKLTLEVEIKGNSAVDNFEFASSVAVIVKDSILIEPVRVNDKVVGFSSDNVSVNLLLMREKKSPVIWRRIGINTVTYKENTYYKVSSKDVGFELNRRNSFRLFIGVEGVCQIGINRKAINVILKDVSESGFSFVMEEDFENAENSAVRVVFSDRNNNFSLNGIIVRKLESNGRYIFGCKLTMRNQVLSRYINEKQRELISRHNGNLSEVRASKMKTLNERINSDEKTSTRSDKYASREHIDGVEKADRREIFREK